MYTPSTFLQDPTITKLINYIWDNKKSLTLTKVKQTDEYKNCCAMFQSWEFLIDEAIKDLIVAAKNHASHDYVVHRDKICYKDQDTLSSNIVFGYNTLFAYFKEHEDGHISKSSLDENIGLDIYCGQFSYAEIPHLFNVIMGVTGTLQTLSNPERNIMNNVYKILVELYLPSIYGDKHLKFNPNRDVTIKSNDDYFNCLANEINSCLVGRQGKRAVMVFFESTKKVDEAYNHKAFASIADTIMRLTEGVDEREKELLIKKATTQGQITFLSRSFGRGTDFRCEDEVLANNGGAHVIQTFLSEEKSEEIQHMGRTARQGGQGSYSLFLNQDSLEKFHISKEDVVSAKNVYKMIDEKRIIFFKQQYQNNVKYAQSEKEEHARSMRFLSTLDSKFLTSKDSDDYKTVRDFLAQQNQGSEIDVDSRTICLMDATMSMSQLLQKTKNAVGDMFSRACEILKENNISRGFEIQFVVYRNYNAPADKILESSTWESKPENLRRFMNTIHARNGWGNEAIEIGLSHVNKEINLNHVSQVILIGDAPPNEEHDVTFKRKESEEKYSFGKDYWKNSRYTTPTVWSDEIKSIIENETKIHTFYVKPDAKEKFQEIADMTNGKCAFLDVRDPQKGSELLTEFVTKAILKNIGGKEKGEELVKAYSQKFKAYR